MKKLRSVKVSSVFKVSAILGAVLGLVVGFVFMISDFLDHQYSFGLLTLVLAPPLYAILFAAGNSLMAWVYNKIAQRTGGIEFTFQE